MGPLLFQCAHFLNLFQTHQNLSGTSSSTMSTSPSSGSYHPTSPFLSPSSDSSGRTTASSGKQHKTSSPGKPRHSPKKMGKSPSPSLKSTARRNIALENVQQGSQKPVSPKPAEEGKAEATCSPGIGAVVVLISGYRSPAHFYIQLEEKQEELLK